VVLVFEALCIDIMYAFVIEEWAGGYPNDFRWFQPIYENRMVASGTVTDKYFVPQIGTGIQASE